VDPSQQPFRFSLDKLLDGTAKPPGLWQNPDKPYNDHQYEAVIENPGAYGDHPFTLDEEFELRRLTGTHFTSRLEEFGGGGLNCTPETVTNTRAANRANLTTVSWTSEVRPDYETGGQFQQVETPLADGENPDWSPRKIDLNLDPIEEIRSAMTTGYVFDESDPMATEFRNQLLANIAAFRDGRGGDPLKPCQEAGNKVGAAPQPVFSKIQVRIDSQELDDKGEPVSTVWAVEVQIISPWRGDVAGDTGGLSVGNVTLTAVPGQGYVGGIDFEPPFPKPGEAKMPPNAEAGNQWTHIAKVETKGAAPVSTVLLRIELRAAGVPIDVIDSTVIAELSAADSRHRLIYHELEKRRPDDPDDNAIDVVAFGEWVQGDGGGGMTGFSFAGEIPDNAVPVRFPRSVKISTDAEDMATRTLPAKGLPPYPPTVAGGGGATSSFRAFARVADLNQVLYPTEENYNKAQAGNREHFFWPWVTTVAEAAGKPMIEQEKVKFNWNDNDPTPGTYSRMNAANVFCVGGPWLDRLDNDGDGETDEAADKGTGPHDNEPEQGRFGGPELRVAGKINLNTATEATLRALANSFDMPEELLWNYVKHFRSQNMPFVTPAQIVRHIATQNISDPLGVGREEAIGMVERRDLPYTLISNIASVRSDTFSIYGTIEYGFVQGDPPNNSEFQVQRRRRFWALVDRSPCLAYPPGQLGSDEDFIRPRVLNFQWLD